MAILGVNIDHVATVREARKTNEPDPVWAAALAELGGADGITLHLREDRRHIQDRDVRVMRETAKVPINLELATDQEVLDLACEVKPHQATIVPERREEVTTEGGLDVIASRADVAAAISRMKDSGIQVSLFLDPVVEQIEMAKEIGADAVELHTGMFALASATEQSDELSRLARAGQMVRDCGMILHAGHGLNYGNVQPIAAIEGMQELNIGHSIISRAVFVGMQQAVREMKSLIS